MKQIMGLQKKLDLKYAKKKRTASKRGYIIKTENRILESFRKRKTKSRILY